MTIRITGRMENVHNFYKFGFVIDDAGRKVILHSEVLLESGFTKEQVTTTSVLVVEAVSALKGLKARRVISLDGRAGTAFPLKVWQSTSTKPVVKSPTITLDCFSNTKQIDCNRETEHRIFSVKSKFGKLVQYLVADSTGLVLRQLGRVTLQEARLNINKVITPPLPLRYGEKTNDPAISRAMAFDSGHDNKKKKDAK